MEPQRRKDAKEEARQEVATQREEKESRTPRPSPGASLRGSKGRGLNTVWRKLAILPARYSMGRGAAKRARVAAWNPQAAPRRGSAHYRVLRITRLGAAHCLMVEMTFRFAAPLQPGQQLLIETVLEEDSCRAPHLRAQRESARALDDLSHRGIIAH